MHFKSPQAASYSRNRVRVDEGPLMRTAKLATLLSLAVMLTTGACEAKPAKKKPAANANWYPASIALPGGLNYSCSLTPLPAQMDGIPGRDRLYINHAFAMILKCAQAKTIMVSKLKRGSARNAYAVYYASTIEALKTIRSEPTPRGLETFRNEVLHGLITQMKFFEKASTAAEAGTDFNSILKIPEGRQASNHLQSAWSQLKARYTNCSPTTENSMYHHLCALDMF